MPKGYIYFAMAFSFGVEMLNIRVRKRRTRADQAAAAQLADVASAAESPREPK